MHDEDCTCGIPEGAVVMNVLTVVEYMTEDGEIWKGDFSHDSAGNEMDHGKLLELCEWARMIRSMSIMADMIHDLEDE
ncbi:hypothetical protein SEA_YEET_161 [Mycobacterium phage Yeet]|uniref:Uncharacterized protein n=4 Tax=Omegavirus TaxID=1623292 RepID=A0A3S9UB36_9CAUD|nr:hypothetical protein [Acinetobacter baumannii]YP_008410321.1 hypothetical protein N860_gp163 [Mycobacterium phage Redno2]YP_009018164.1 hypothetical protein CL87_gp153 [Mycobacterium phage Thibault]YP_009124122.1 hypothetical protein VC71_gp169 [Mycobacterium phage Minerva]YP_009591024.1 hypothetical protein FDG54_gp168 [Mycobacterium phage Optimus]YP_009636346.1 hypothetical protein FGG20_gp175 [Mycobacterium phage Baka]ATN88978.1 hypothetical protein SEA_DMPSTRDIVER_171 [Mycobacterium ph